MSQEVKPIVSKEETFDKLEIRLGKVMLVEEAPHAPKKSYRLKIDFGKFGMKTSVARFTQHPPEEILHKQVMAVLNFEPRLIGETLSEVLVVGVQFPKGESGEATFITPAKEAKIGSKLF